ncbi:MAG: AsmA family protein, partial [Deltaproteobacteria bacterium]|nr:AsmA family protein [Deltaproteobacteria bacterium]
MKKFLKIAVVILGVFLVLIIALSLFVKSYLTQERMRALVLETTQKSLNRQATLGEINVSFFKGIVVKDFEIKEKDSDAVFFKTKEFVLKYQLLPLLTKKLVIDKLSVADVEIYLKANPDGTYNFSDMIKKDRLQEQKDESAKAAGLPVNLSVKDITIRNAKLSYVNATGGLKKTDVIVNAEMRITGLSGNALSSEGSIDTTIAEALLKDKVFKNIRTAARYKIDVDMEAKNVTLHSLDLDVMQIPVNIAGNLNYVAGTSYALVVKVPEHDLSGIKPDVASAFLPKGMALGGKIA